MKRRLSILTALCIFLLILFTPAKDLFAAQQMLRFAWPAPALLSVLQGLLPIPLPTDQKTFSGSVRIQSIDQLHIHDNTITVHGIIRGDNIAVHTTFAGQKLKVKLGNLSLPVAYDIDVRLDTKQHALFFTPHLRATGNNIHDKDPLADLLNGLSRNREYQLSSADVDTFLSNSLGRPVRLGLQPVLLDLNNNTLTFGLQPISRQSTNPTKPE